MEGLPEFVAEEDYSFIPRENLVIICTGSQGEARAALAKLARNEMKTVALAPGDTVVFSSRTIPGNEKAILEIKNSLIDQGVKIIEDTDALVHVSGHPRRNELRRMYEWVRPRIGVPVHGEAAHLVAQGSLMALPAFRKSPRCAMATCCGLPLDRQRSSTRFRSGGSTRTETGRKRRSHGHS